jgi:hypothetical protein
MPVKQEIRKQIVPTDQLIPGTKAILSHLPVLPKESLPEQSILYIADISSII